MLVVMLVRCEDEREEEEKEEGKEEEGEKETEEVVVPAALSP